MKWPWGQRVVRAETAPDDVEAATLAKVNAEIREVRDERHAREARQTSDLVTAVQERVRTYEAFLAPRAAMTREEIRAMLADLDLDSLRHLHRGLWTTREARWTNVTESVVNAAMCDGGEGPEAVALPRIAAAYLPAQTLRRPRAIARAVAKATVEADAALTAVLSVVEAMIEEKMQAQVGGGA